MLTANPKRPKGAASKQPKAAPWVVGEKGILAPKGQKHFLFATKLVPFQGGCCALHFTQGSALGYLPAGLSGRCSAVLSLLAELE